MVKLENSLDFVKDEIKALKEISFGNENDVNESEVISPKSTPGKNNCNTNPFGSIVNS